MWRSSRVRRRRWQDDDDDEYSSGNWLTRVVFQPPVLIVLAAVVSLPVLVPQLLRSFPDLRGRDEYTLTAQDIHILPLVPDWIPEDFVAQTLLDAGIQEPFSVLDVDLSARLAAAFAVQPWVSRVVRVEKAAPAQVRVELEFHAPVAMVEVKQGFYPVGADGLLLPPADFTADDAARYPRIQGVLSTPDGPAGTPWGDVGVVGAARLAEVLVPIWQRLGLGAILVPKREQAEVPLDSLNYVVLTPGGSRIIWGRAPGSSHPGELAPEQKIGRLQKYFADFGSFDKPHGPYEIDIRHWQEISRRPLAARSEAKEQL
jgi:hypothetical protein